MGPEHGAAATATLFGGFRLAVGGRTVTSWRAGKSRALFQLLLLHRGRVVPAERLRRTLWPDLRTSSASGSLKVAAHAVRRVLAGDRDGEPVAEICYVNDGYLLTRGRLVSDVELFEDHIGVAASAARTGDTVTATDRFHAAVMLHRGPLLPEEDAAWAFEHRERTRLMALRALHHLRVEAARAGQPRAVVRWCHRILALDPYDELGYADLVASHRSLGDEARAQRWSERAALQLADL